MRARQDYSRSRDKDHQVANDRERFMKGPNKTQNDSNIPNVVEIYNYSQHYNKEEIAYFIYNQLDKVKGLLKKSLNPIVRSQLIPEKNCIQLEFRTREQALNCLELNGIYWGNRAFYMKSKLTPRDRPKLDVHNVRMRIVGNKVEESFNKLFIGNLPEMQEFEVIDMLWSIGQVKSIQNITTNKNQVQYFCEFKASERTDEYLSKLNQLKIKNRSIIAKRAALMNTSQTSKSKVRARRSMFERDISEFYLTLDIQSYFKDRKISCVLLLKNVISNFMVKDEILRDLKRQIGKVGSIVKMLDYEKNVYIEFEKVEYAQIAYLLINQRKFQGKSIDVSFYDPINFADQILM